MYKLLQWFELVPSRFANDSKDVQEELYYIDIEHQGSHHVVVDSELPPVFASNDTLRVVHDEEGKEECAAEGIEHHHPLRLSKHDYEGHGQQYP